MGERLTIGFADRGAPVQGVAIEGAGALLAVDERVAAAPAFTLTDIDGAACRVDGAGAYDVSLEPLAAPVELGPATRIWICRAGGTVGERRLDGFGSIVRTVADRAGLERMITAWLGAELAVVLAARRPPRAAGHGEEDLHAAILRGTPLEASAVHDPRVSTTYDADGRLLRCGLELWETAEAEFPRRVGGRATGHGELTDADGARTRVAFVAWRGDGESGFGHYVISER